jgi:hypothetical protein
MKTNSSKKSDGQELPVGTLSRASWREPLIITMILSGAAIGGFALTDYDPQRASWYWVLILPVFAAVAVWHTWKSLRVEGKTNWPLIRRQIYPWLALLIAIKVLFFLIYAGTFSGQAPGLVALLLVALTCTLVGINVDMVFILVGIVLTCAVIIAVQFRKYIWLLLIALAVAFAALELIRRLTRPKGTPEQ